MSINMGFGVQFREYDLPKAHRSSRSREFFLPERLHHTVDFVLWQFGQDPASFQTEFTDGTLKIIGPSLSSGLKDEMRTHLMPLRGVRQVEFLEHTLQ